MIRPQSRRPRRCGLRIAMLGALLLAGIASGAGAQGAGAPRTPPAADREPPPPGDTTPVSLRDCIEVALASNLGLQAEEILTRTSALDILASQGVFDPVAFSDMTHVEFESPTASRLESGEQTIGVITGARTSFDAGIRKRLFTGLDAELRLSQVRDKTTRAFLLLNPSYTTNFGLTVTQPLLKDAGRRFNLSGIRIARNTVDITSAQYRQRIEELVLQVIEAYWQLGFAEQDLRVKVESLELAVKEREIADSKVNSGLWAPLELDQARTEEFSRRAERVQAEKALEDARDALRTLLYPMDDVRDWNVHLATKDRLKEVDLEQAPGWLEQQEQGLPSWSDALDLALERRPETVQARLDIRNKEIAIRNARNQFLPTFDLTGSYTWNVLGESVRDNYGDILFPNDRTWTAGFQFEIPIGNRAARADLAKARLEKRRARLLLKEQENQVISEIREAIRAIATSLEKIGYSHRALLSARKQLRAAKSRRKVGIITNFEVLQFQRDLSQADQNLNEAWREYRVARARLEKAKGTLTVKDEGGLRITVLEP